MKRFVFVIGILSGLFLLGCGTPEPTGDPITINFSAMVGDKSFSCGQTFTDLGTSKSSFRPQDLRLYVHDIKLVNSAGKAVSVTLKSDGKWQKDGVALLDFEDKTGFCTFGTTDTRTVVEGTIPKGTYKGLSFTVGVPFSLNHLDAFKAQAPLNVTAMFWSWQSGYKFFRVDGEIGSNKKIYRFHIGSITCESDKDGKVTKCERPNRPSVSLPLYEPGKQAVVLDVAKLLSKVDLTKNQDGTAYGCMSEPKDDDCKTVYNSFGLTYNDAIAKPSEQTVFSLKPLPQK